MPSTTTTIEQFPAGTPKARVEEERRLRIRAGAITSVLSGSEENGWTLTTTWNVIGEDDD